MIKTITSQLMAAWGTMRRHYFVLVIACILTMLLGGEFFDTAQFIRIDFFASDTEEETEERLDIYDVLSAWDQGKTDGSVDLARQLMEQVIDKATDNRIFGHSRGVIAGLVNKVTSGYFLVQFLAVLTGLVHSRNAANILTMVLLLAVISVFWIFVRNMCVVVSRRLVLEGRCYERLSFGRVTHFFRIGKWMHVAGVMLVSYTLQMLWCATIVGGPIKRYSYYLVPYIMAENPELSARQAITLSKRMMDGHKMGLFMRELMFLIAPGISLLTGGLSDVFFFNPLRASYFTQCYADIRREAKEKGIEGTELLKDESLFAVPDIAERMAVYTDVRILREKAETTEMPGNKVVRFAADWFGLIFTESRRIREYEYAVAQKGFYEDAIAEMEGKAYPLRFCPCQEVQRRIRKNRTGYLCHYSVWSLVIIFVTFSFIGWIWEVLLHFAESGEFVNRGVLHGPWIPIYGTGAVLILLLLYRFRAKPGVEFALSVLLSGIVEYGTSYVMEVSNDGKRWWDYTGYFLNFGGRICAEGLLLFGVGGMAVVYLAAPAINGWLRKMSWEKVIAAALALGLLFAADAAYSQGHPNTGEGITTVRAQGEALA